VVEFIKLALMAVLKIFGYLGNEQLLEAGENRQKLKNAEAENEARKKTKANNAAIDSLSDSDVIVRMRKWKRKDL
jgi:hypothetical protein